VASVGTEIMKIRVEIPATAIPITELTKVSRRTCWICLFRSERAILRVASLSMIGSPLFGDPTASKSKSKVAIGVYEY
jgi:hypothetical protein